MPNARQEHGFSLIELMVAMFVLILAMLGMVMLVDLGNRNTASNLRREGANNLVREIVERAREVGYASLAPDANNRPAALLALPGLATTGQPGTWTLNDRRGKTVYTVTARVCSIDDHSDGIGARDVRFCDMANTDPENGGGGAGASLLSVYTDLARLGLNINVDLSGSGAAPLCNLLGANPNLNSALGGMASLIAGGSDVHLCGSSTSSRFPIDRNPDDLKRVVVEVSWADGSVRQSTVIPNPANGAIVT